MREIMLILMLYFFSGLNRLEEDHYARAKANIAATIMKARIRDIQSSQSRHIRLGSVPARKQLSARISQSLPPLRKKMTLRFEPLQ